jgi:hypothetical protein
MQDILLIVFCFFFGGFAVLSAGVIPLDNTAMKMMQEASLQCGPSGQQKIEIAAMGDEFKLICNDGRKITFEFPED